MATDRLATTDSDNCMATVPAPPVGERPTIQRSLSAKKKKIEEDLSASVPGQSSALYRHLRQHRNSWPTIEAAAATAAAKAIKRTSTQTVVNSRKQLIGYNLRPKLIQVSPLCGNVKR